MRPLYFICIIWFCGIISCLPSNSDEIESILITELDECWNSLKNPDELEFQKIIPPPVNNGNIAIAFFNNYENILKYDVEGKSDSLQDHLKLNNRQNIYWTLDNVGVFQSEIKQTLIDLKVPLVESQELDIDSTLSLKGIEQNYHLSLSEFREYDGIILFNENRKPKIWRINNELSECSEIEKVKSYFTAIDNGC